MAKATFGTVKSMTMSDPDSPARRMTIAITGAVGIMVAAGLVYLLVVSKDTAGRFNGAAIVAAARAYTKDLEARRQPIPPSVTLDELVASHFLKPEDAAAFRGLKATVMLTSADRGPKAQLMRVRLPDGSEVVLLGDGTVQVQTATSR
jgi:hypothetical protein